VKARLLGILVSLSRLIKDDDIYIYIPATKIEKEKKRKGQRKKPPMRKGGRRVMVLIIVELAKK